MNTTTFDTLKAARALEASGIERHQAEVIVSTMRDAADTGHDELATRADVAAVKADIAALKADIGAVKWVLAVQSAFILAMAAKLFGIV